MSGSRDCRPSGSGRSESGWRLLVNAWHSTAIGWSVNAWSGSGWSGSACMWNRSGGVSKSAFTESERSFGVSRNCAMSKSAGLLCAGPMKWMAGEMMPIGQKLSGLHWKIVTTQTSAARTAFMTLTTETEDAIPTILWIGEKVHGR